MHRFEVTSAADTVHTVRQHGFALWRGLVARDLVNTVPCSTVRYMNNVKAYESVKYRVLRLDVVPERNRLIAPEVVEVFNAALGPHEITIQEIYLSTPDQYLPHPWHQDANKDNQLYHFMVWIAATQCGVDAPGLSFAIGNPGKYLGESLTAELAGREVVDLIMSPGDAVFFDVFSLHKTNITPTMVCSRVAYKLGAKAI